MAFDLIHSPIWSGSWRVPSLFEEDPDSLIPTTGGNVSISEDDKSVYISAALPGVDQSDIDITFDKGLLWIKGETTEQEQDKKRKFYRKAVSSFSYRVAVPGEIDMTVEPEATYHLGVMTVKFSKSPAAQPKKIAVKTGK